jgi:hypothetical protein
MVLVILGHLVPSPVTLAVAGGGAGVFGCLNIDQIQLPCESFE